MNIAVCMPQFTLKPKLCANNILYIAQKSFGGMFAEPFRLDLGTKTTVYISMLSVDAKTLSYIVNSYYIAQVVNNTPDT